MSISNTPQAKDDAFAGTEDRLVTFDVMANDLGGNGKSLYSVDQTNPLHAALTATSSMGATISIVGGKVVYDSAGAAQIQALAAGQTATDTFQYVIQLGNGTLSVANVTITVTGTNDGPVLSADPVASHALTEVAGATGSTAADGAQATLAFGDLDLNDTHSVSIGAPAATWSNGATPAATLSALNGALSSVLHDSTGTGAGSVGLTFQAADQAFDFLAKGETLTVSYDLTVTDNNGAAATRPVTFVVTGTNDGPVVAADAVATHTVGEVAGASGSSLADTAAATLSFADVDLNDTHSVSIGAPAATWSNGTIPAATLSALNGALSSALHDSTGTGAGAVDLSFSAADKAFDFLATGETLTVSYDVTVTDNNGAASTKAVTFVVTGTNDGPVLAADAVASHALTEAAGATGSSATDGFATTLAFTDVDLTDSHAVSIGGPVATWANGTIPAATLSALNGALSSVLHDAAGTGAGSVDLSFSAPDAAFDFLAAGESLKISYDVTVTDGHGGTSTQTVSFTVTGADDSPTLSAQTSLEHIVNGGFDQSNPALAGYGWSTASDAIEINPAGVYGVTGATGNVLELDANSTTPRDDVFQTFATTAGQAYTFGFDTALRAGTSASDNTFEVLWNGVVIDTVTAHSTGVEHHNYTLFGDGGQDKIEFRELTTNNNSLGGIIDNVSVKDAIAERAGQTGAQASDTSSVTLKLTDVDLNDAHTISRGSTSIVWSGGPTLPSGLAPAIDNALTVSLDDTTGKVLGSVTATFSAPDATFDFLAQGETLTVTYGLTVNDGHGGVATRPVTFIVAGANDGPVLAAQGNPLTVAEQVGVTGSASIDAGATLLQFTDADLRDHHTATVGAPTIAWTGGSTLPAGLSAQLTGALTTSVTDFGDGAGNLVASFSAPDKAFDFMSQGESLTITYNVTLSDGHGGTSTQPVVVTMLGRNDAPVATVTSSGATFSETSGVTGSSTLRTSVANLSFADVDLNDHHTTNISFATASLSAGTLPGAVLAALQNDAQVTSLVDSTGTGAGSAVVTFSAADSTFDFLGQGQSLSVTYDVAVVDSAGAASVKQVTFVINGANDAPLARVDTVATLEDTPVTFDPRANDTDPDSGAVLHVTSINGTAIATGGSVAVSNGGSVTLNADGALTYNPGLNDNGARSFTYTVSDENGATSTSTVNVTVTPVNDAPVGVDDLNVKPSLVNNSDFATDLHGWSLNNGPTSSNFTSYSGSASWISSFGGHNGVAQLTLNGTVNVGGGSGYGPTMRSDNFTASAGDTVSFDWRLASGSDWALGNGFIKDAATGATVATVFNFNQGQSGDTGWHHTDVVLQSGGTYYMEFQVGSYDSTFGRAVGATMYLDFAGVLPQITEDKVLTITGSQLLANDTDVDSTGLTIASVVGVSDLGATVVLNADGTISYDPRTALNYLNTGQSAVDGFTYTVRDPSGATDTAHVTFTVQGRDEPHLVQYLTNPSFEDTVTGGVVPGWTNTGGTALEVVPAAGYGIGGGGHVLDSQGTPGGITISQSFDVATGQAATITIDLAKELVNGSLHPNSTLTVTFDGQVVLTLNESNFANYNQLQTFTVNVVGQAGTDTLVIHDNGTGNVGYAIDQVKVEGWVF